MVQMQLAASLLMDLVLAILLISPSVLVVQLSGRALPGQPSLQRQLCGLLKSWTPNSGEGAAESAGVATFSKIAGPPGNHGPAGRAVDSFLRANTTAVADLLD